MKKIVLVAVVVGIFLGLHRIGKFVNSKRPEPIGLSVEILTNIVDAGLTNNASASADATAMDTVSTSDDVPAVDPTEQKRNKILASLNLGTNGGYGFKMTEVHRK